MNPNDHKYYEIGTANSGQSSVKAVFSFGFVFNSYRDSHIYWTGLLVDEIH